MHVLIRSQTVTNTLKRDCMNKSMHDKPVRYIVYPKIGGAKLVAFDDDCLFSVSHQ